MSLALAAASLCHTELNNLLNSLYSEITISFRIFQPVGLQRLRMVVSVLTSPFALTSFTSLRPQTACIVFVQVSQSTN